MSHAQITSRDGQRGADVDVNFRLTTVGATGVSAFGEAKVAEITPVVQMQFPYNINAAISKVRANGGTVTQSLGHAVMSTGASANQSAILLSVNPVKYNPGQGGIVRFTSLFTTGVVGSTQWVGLGDAGDGYFFGYNGADFAIMRRDSGAPEIRALTIGTQSSHVEDITITLDGDADTGVAVTSGADATVTANEIAAHDFSGLGTGWETHVNGNLVHFISYDGAVHTGAYSLSASQSSAGTFAQTIAGVVPTETVVNQSDWNLDPADGTKVLSALDQTKGNVYEIQYQWLGYGAITFSLENPTTGEFVPVHRIEYANTNTSASLQNPTLPLCAMVVNTSNTSAMIVKIGSMMGGIEGKEPGLGLNAGASGQNLDVGTTEIPVLTILNKVAYQSKVNRTKVKLGFASLSNDHNQAVKFAFYGNATLVAGSFSDVSANTSVMQSDTAATSFTSGTFLFSVVLAKTTSAIVQIPGPAEGLILPGNHLTVTADAIGGTGGDVDVALNWTEFF